MMKSSSNMHHTQYRKYSFHADRIQLKNSTFLTFHDTSIDNNLSHATNDIPKRPPFIANSIANISNLVTGGHGSSEKSNSSPVVDKNSFPSSTYAAAATTTLDPPLHSMDDIVAVTAATNTITTTLPKYNKKKSNKKLMKLQKQNSMTTMAHAIVNDPIQWKKFKDTCAAKHHSYHHPQAGEDNQSQKEPLLHYPYGLLTTRLALQKLSNDLKKRNNNSSSRSSSCSKNESDVAPSLSLSNNNKKKQLQQKKENTNRGDLLSVPPPPIFMREESVSTPCAQSVKRFFAHQMKL